MKKKIKVGLLGISVLFFLFIIFGEYVYADETDQLIIALDPGHGGEENGAYYYGIKEKEVNYQIAQKVKKKLEAYTDVEVILTREKDEELGLWERVNRAALAKADIFISLHCNASVTHKSKGASIYISTGESNRKNLQQLADHLLGEFESIGLENAGTIARVTELGSKRADGSFEDYYGVLRHSYNSGIPAILIEHCYMDYDTDRVFLESEEGLEKLAQADANGIISYFQLKNKKGKTIKAKHAKVFGGTTKAIELNYFEAPKIMGIKLLEYDGKSPGIAKYEIEVEDGVGLSSMYLVYTNDDGEAVTISLTLEETLTAGKLYAQAYIPENLKKENYSLAYIGVYNKAGYDAGYNYSEGKMVGFGKCDWLNEFAYTKEADFKVKKKGSMSTAHLKMIEYEMQIGLRDKRNYYPPCSIYPN